MLRYAFYRIYSRQIRQASDDTPLLSAIGLWAMYVLAPFIPVVVTVRYWEAPWMPVFVILHPAMTAMLLTICLMIVCYLVWVRNGSYARIGDIYATDPVWLKRLRGVVFWLWLALGAGLMVVVGWIGVTRA